MSKGDSVDVNEDAASEVPGSAPAPPCQLSICQTINASDFAKHSNKVLDALQRLLPASFDATDLIAQVPVFIFHVSLQSQENMDTSQVLYLIHHV